MGTKNDPGKFDCYANAAPDEPMFVLLARDPLAPELVRDWADRRARTLGASDKTIEAYACATAMEHWQNRNVQPSSEALIVLWTKLHDEPIPWSKAVEIVSVINKLSPDEKARLLDLDNPK